MILADAVEPVRIGTAVISTFDGVTTALVAFVLFCFVFPDRVKNRPQFYAGFFAVVGIILLHTMSLMLAAASGFQTVAAVATGGLQVGALVLFLLCVGGITAKQFAGDVLRSYEVMRRGETTKETIIPIGEQAREHAKVYTYPPADHKDD